MSIENDERKDANLNCIERKINKILVSSLERPKQYTKSGEVTAAEQRSEEKITSKIKKKHGKRVNKRNIKYKMRRAGDCT